MLLGDVGRFSEGLAAAVFGSEFDDRWGYVDESGSTVIPGKYARAAPFSEGKAAVQLAAKTTMNGSRMTIEMGAWTFIDRNGTPLGVTFHEIRAFSQGLAAVSNGKGWGFINKNGKTVIPLVYADVTEFSEDLACTRVGGDVLDDADYDSNYKGRWGFIDRSAKVVISHRFSKADSFSEGLAAVCDANYPEDQCWGFVDAAGKVAIAPAFSRAGPFREGLAPVCNGAKEGQRRCGAIDAKGNVKIPLVYSNIQTFQSGIALAKKSSGKFVFINEQGRAIGESLAGAGTEYEDARDFWNGIAAVKLGGLWGFVDRTGKMIVRPQFLAVSPDWNRSPRATGAFGLDG
jgi:hypothetical protein